MKPIHILMKILSAIVFIINVLSCEDDFNSVGSEIIGDVNFQDSLYVSIPVAYSKKFERVRTDNLSYTIEGRQDILFHSSMLGVYNDPIYGQSVYSVLSQIQAPSYPITFGNNAVLDSVVLTLPYLSRPVEQRSVDVSLTNADGTTVIVPEMVTTYELDSIYQNQPFKLSIYQSNYFLRDFDPSTTERQAYYSNDLENFEAQLMSKDPLFVNTSFVPSNAELILTSPDTESDDDTAPDRNRVAPRLRAKLPVETFKEQFLDKEGSTELSNSSNFENYFRGIYLKAEPNDSGTGNLLYFNLREATITLYYKTETAANGDTPATESQEELTLSFSTNAINFINTAFNPMIAAELAPDNQDQINGEENLYLKGGDGSIAVIDLFNRTVVNENGEEENEFEYLKRQNWLINDANLKFYINQDLVTSGDAEPERIYIFNMENGSILGDYGLDIRFQLSNLGDPVNSILNHLGRINRGADDQGEFYRIRLTQHIIDLFNEDVENIKLGVSVSQNVNITSSTTGDTVNESDEIIPTSSIISHEGTILYGNSPNVPESKRLQLEIFYTVSKNNITSN
ncbi:DUF4270 domain-containing protein [Aquimarina sp. U1-2]|uniref:DUF4270 domain-containing protein n=1 Tax=Aquimarina sp. U1-2 TaxID=2823141 RepID=UPI001AEC80E4|nr:DUF4270 domain-containing protein [Aquimarina sp. U1-2]MBP2831340.1 DUF4270 domain-containing protein [Aquimarina sp. U1-2]